MKSYKIFSFKKFKNVSGELLPITFDKKFPIKVKRIFFIYGKKKYKRGDHAHKKCTQIFLSLKGSIEMTIESQIGAHITNEQVFGVWSSEQFFQIGKLT